MTIKAFLEKDGKKDAEIRRFPVPADVSTNFAYFSKKIATIFPSLREDNFTTFWKGICLIMDHWHAYLIT